MLNLIFIDVQHSQKAVFIFEKDLNGQNHSSASHYLVKKFPQQNFQSSHHWEQMKKPPLPLLPPPPHTYTLALFGTPCNIFSEIRQQIWTFCLIEKYDHISTTDSSKIACSRAKHCNIYHCSFLFLKE